MHLESPDTGQPRRRTPARRGVTAPKRPRTSASGAQLEENAWSSSNNSAKRSPTKKPVRIPKSTRWRYVHRTTDRSAICLPIWLPDAGSNARHPLLRVVDDGATEIEAYLGEDQIASVAVGQPVPVSIRRRRDCRSPTGRQRDRSAAGHAVRHPLLASPHGGGIVATQAARDTFVAHEAIYRVRIKTLAGEPRAAGWYGGACASKPAAAIGWSGMRHAVSVLVREGGF